ncbi:MAG: hypothetical protein E6Q97_07490 [Desulfurellales bacterium]|nr:MAG: hypothetical protein E6Q97_07490 [Desulfurellales bacterium]
MARKYSSEYKNLQPYVVEDIRKVVTAAGASGGGSVTSGVTDHGALTGLSDDDHPQYLTPVRGDARYIPSTRTLTAGDGLTGGGDLSADRAFAVGAGNLITVAADSVAVANGTGTYQFIGTGSGTTAGWHNGSELAGDGLTHGTALAVGVSGLGLSVGADAVTLASSSNPGATASILASSAAGLLTLYNGAFTQTAGSAATFASGFAGSGWRADYGITTASKASFECDDLTVRGRMRVYELLIQQIRATNGSVFVSSASKVVTTTAGPNPTWTVNGSQLTFNGSNATFATTIYTITTAAAGDTSRELYHGFLYGDLIRAQQVQWNGSSFSGVIQSDLEVTSVSNLYTYNGTLVSGDAPAIGYDYVRVGNSYDTTRQGSIYLTSDDSAAPFIDIVDGVYSHAVWNSAGVTRVRVGKLSGITDWDFGGPLSGYGLYGNNVYLKGNIYATSGIFNGTVYASGGIFSGTVHASDGDFTGTVTATSGTIGGWSVGATSLTAGSGANTVGIDSGGTNPAFYAGSATPGSAPFRVTKTGDITATGTLIASSGGISGNFYVGSDVGASGNLYVGSNADMRFSADGIRCILPTAAGANIPTASQAIRWFPSGTGSWTSAVSYAGLITYKNPSPTPTVMDLILTSCVGDDDDAVLDARAIFQAGHYAGGAYTDARLEVVREKGSGAKYVATYGDRLEVENCIRLTEMSDPSNPSANQAYLFTKDNGSGKTQLCVKFSSGASIVIATQA